MSRAPRHLRAPSTIRCTAPCTVANAPSSASSPSRNNASGAMGSPASISMRHGTHGSIVSGEPSHAHAEGNLYATVAGETLEGAVARAALADAPA